MSDTAHLSLIEKMRTETSFRKRAFVLILGLLVVQMTSMGVTLHNSYINTLEDSITTRVKPQSQEIVNDQTLIQEVTVKNLPAIEQVVDRMKTVSGASFIALIDEQRTWLFHPVKAQIGKVIQSNEYSEALLRAEPYTLTIEDEFGYGIRAYSPIVGFDGNIIGNVIIGYSLNEFDQWLSLYTYPLLVELVLIFCLTLLGAWLLSTHVKQKMNGMEPADMALTFNLQKSILKSVYEGVIAIDKKGFILAVNNNARELLDTEESIKHLRTRRIIEYVSSSQFFFQTPFEDNLKDEIISINGKTLIANRVAIFDQNVLIGWVVSFRDKNEMNSLTAELTQIKQYTDNLKVMRKEHANKLSLIGGLIENGDSDAALALINQESNRKQELIEFVSSRILCKQVAGILLGKYATARELGLDIQLDPTCQLYNLNERISADELSAVIGSLIDNAFEATLKNPDSSKVVKILITDASHELVIEVTDNGCGISPEIASNIFARGVTSKDDEDKHGIGLYLINRYVTNAGGVILVDNAEPKGTIFSLFIPNSVLQ